MSDHSVRTVNQFRNCEIIAIDVAVDAVCVCLCLCMNVNRRARAPTTKVECDLFCFVFHFWFCAIFRDIINANERETHGGNKRMRMTERDTKRDINIHRNHVGLHTTIIQKLCHRLSVCCVCSYIFWSRVDKYRNRNTVSLMMFRIHHRQSIVCVVVSESLK